MRNRHPLTHDPANSCEDISMISWVYGDPSKIRLIHGGVKETHVFHFHNHQWHLEGENQNSTIIDSISISPQECYTLDILHGAGSLNGTFGDVIFYCHLYPHFHEGMWTLWRIHDRLEDGRGCFQMALRFRLFVLLQTEKHLKKNIPICTQVERDCRFIPNFNPVIKK